MIDLFELTPGDEIKSRVSKLQERMGEKEIDLALIFQSVDLFYFTPAAESHPGFCRDG